MLKVCC